MDITFHGAVKEVTGSKHLIRLANGKQILLDCGFFQGKGRDSASRNRYFDFDPARIDYLILSHAHIDHSGNIPTLVKRGFKGIIYCTPPTLSLCEIMLSDSAHIQQSDMDYLNRKRAAVGKSPLRPLYKQEDVDEALRYFRTVPYNKQVQIDPDIKLQFTDAGHILGSAVVNLTIKEGRNTKRLCFSGDVGRFINKILPVPQPFPQANTLICESTYGNRTHESMKEAREKLKQAVYETCYAKGGKLIIPAFSIGKTQELIYTLNKLELQGKLPRIKVFVDSPLAISATRIMQEHPECFSEATRRFMEKDPDPFGFNQLYYIRDVETSKQINELQEPCIVISASGMAEAGRVKHHLANSIEDERNSVLIIGYSDPSSLSGKLIRGDEKVSIFGKVFDVKANIYQIDFFSAHADSNELMRFLSCQDPARLKQVFLVHGNNSALTDFKSQLNAQGYYRVEIAQEGMRYPL